MARRRWTKQLRRWPARLGCRARAKMDTTRWMRPRTRCWKGALCAHELQVLLELSEKLDEAEDELARKEQVVTDALDLLIPIPAERKLMK